MSFSFNKILKSRLEAVAQQVEQSTNDPEFKGLNLAAAQWSE